MPGREASLYLRYKEQFGPFRIVKSSSHFIMPTLSPQKVRFDDMAEEVGHKVADFFVKHLDSLTRSIDLPHLDVFLVGGKIGVEYVNDSGAKVVCSELRHLTGLKPKCIRINGKVSADHGEIPSVASDVTSVLLFLPELRNIAKQADTLEISILDEDTDPHVLLTGFPTTFTHVSVASLCSRSDLLVKHVERIIDSGELRFLNLIGDLKGAIRTLDPMLLKLIGQGRWEEIFVHMDAVLEDEVGFLAAVIKWWKSQTLSWNRELLISFKTDLCAIDFIKDLPLGTMTDQATCTSRRYFYMRHPKDYLREAHFSKDEDGMLHVQLH
uniref:F-box/LRR-repeat protein n=1 Tax=Steinernema glaseri TaxID=37863 RepID=A0A1I7Y5G7_9BILA